MTYEEKGFSSEIQSIYLVDERIEEIENYLETTYGYEPKSVKRQYVEGMIATYGGRSPAAEQECEKLRQALKKNRIPPRYHQTEDLLKALIFIENNREDLYLREVSSLIYGDSKYLEEKVLGARMQGASGLSGDVPAARWRWKMKFWKNIILHGKNRNCV